MKTCILILRAVMVAANWFHWHTLGRLLRLVVGLAQRIGLGCIVLLLLGGCAGQKVTTALKFEMSPGPTLALEITSVPASQPAAVDTPTTPAAGGDRL